LFEVSPSGRLAERGALVESACLRILTAEHQFAPLAEMGHGTQPCSTRRHGLSVRKYLLNRLAADFENFDRATWSSVIEDADCEPPSVPRKGIQVGPVLLENRPIWMLMMAMDDMALAMAAVVIISIDFPYEVVGVLLIQGTGWFNACVYENAMRIGVHER